MRFFLGTHHPIWLTRLDVPLFVSRRRLTDRRSEWPRARVPWAMDSGGFSELTIHGRWSIDAKIYAADVERYATELGNLEWAAPQDWMCEPHMLARTGLSIQEHQRRTTDNLIELRSIVSEVHIIPVLQGWDLDDYLRHVDMYFRAGIDLHEEPVIGVGSVCRRQGTDDAKEIFDRLADEGFNLHGFGVKATGLKTYASRIVSSDSMAWSYNARHRAPLSGCTHKNCANCSIWALRWRRRLLQMLSPPRFDLSDLFEEVL